MLKFTIRNILREINADKLNYRYHISIFNNGDGTSKIIWKHVKIREAGLSVVYIGDIIIPLVLGIISEENFFTSDIRYYLDNEVIRDRSGVYYYKSLSIDQ